VSERQHQLLAAIEAAFRGIELGDGVSLHETVVIDDYGTEGQRRAAREPDEKHDWRRLVRDPDLARICWVGGLSFYDAAGLRFHLPAYLSLAVIDWEAEASGEILGSLLYHLTSLDGYNRGRFAILTAGQRRCVADVLAFVRDEYELERGDIDRAIAEFWLVEPPAAPDAEPGAAADAAPKAGPRC